MNWDASKQNLFYWYKECPRGWTPHWHESDAGHVTIHIIRDAKPDEKTDEEKLNIARGRSYLND